MTERGLRIGVVGLPGQWSTEALATALQARTGHHIVIDLSAVACDLARNQVHHGDLDLCGLDGLIVKKVGAAYSPMILDRLEILRFVAARGVPVFSRPESILGLVDRLAGTVTLRAADVPVPPTTITEDIGHAAQAIRDYGIAVLKPLYSTKARGMEIVAWTTPEEVERKLGSFRNGNPVFYIQKKIDLPGRDLGIAFLGEDYVGSYARVSAKGAWNTTTRDGGHYEAHTPSPEAMAVARRARAAFDLDFTSVDVAESKDGPVVFEVSAFGGFRGLRDALGIDVAERYADYVLARVRHA